MEKTRVLFIANIFPPMGGSGVQRSAKFVKYLREFNIEPFVLTRQVDKGICDHTLLNELPKDLSVVRTKPYDYTQWSGLFTIPGKVIARKILIPDGEVTWYKKSIQIAKKMIQDHKIEAIYSTSYPYSDHLLGLELKKLFPTIPWIVDFRDEWSMNPYIIDKGYSNYRQKKEKAMEEEIAKKCDYFIANTSIMHSNFLTMYPFLAEKSTVITNGFDEEDFLNVDKTYIKKELFVITHPGVIYGNRKIDKIMKAIKELKSEGILDISKVKLQLIGSIKEEDMLRQAKEFGIEEIIDCPGYMSHEDTIKALIDSEVLLLILREGYGGENIAPGKIYEYINSNRRILGLAPKNGVAAAIIHETKTGIVCDTADVTEIKAGLKKYYQEWEKGDFFLEPDVESIKKYERKELTKRLAGIIKQLQKKI